MLRCGGFGVPLLYKPAFVSGGKCFTHFIARPRATHRAFEPWTARSQLALSKLHEPFQDRSIYSKQQGAI